MSPMCPTLAARSGILSMMGHSQAHLFIEEISSQNQCVLGTVSPGLLPKKFFLNVAT